MQIDIQVRNFHLTIALRSHIERRLCFALSARDEYIQRVHVRLSDINGPRGGVDKHCHIQVVLTHLPDVVIKDTEEDIYATIDRAADRAGHTSSTAAGAATHQGPFMRPVRHGIDCRMIRTDLIDLTGENPL